MNFSIIYPNSWIMNRIWIWISFRILIWTIYINIVWISFWFTFQVLVILYPAASIAWMLNWNFSIFIIRFIRANWLIFFIRSLTCLLLNEVLLVIYRRCTCFILIVKICNPIMASGTSDIYLLFLLGLGVFIIKYLVISNIDMVKKIWSTCNIKILTILLLKYLYDRRASFWYLDLVSCYILV
jgi:hypothetical protein